MADTRRVKSKTLRIFFVVVFIGPKSDHWLPLSVTHSCLVDLTDVTLAFEDANSKCLDVVSVVVLMLNFGRNVEAEFWSKF